MFPSYLFLTTWGAAVSASARLNGKATQRIHGTCTLVVQYHRVQDSSVQVCGPYSAKETATNVRETSPDGRALVLWPQELGGAMLQPYSNQAGAWSSGNGASATRH